MNITYIFVISILMVSTTTFSSIPQQRRSCNSRQSYEKANEWRNYVAECTWIDPDFKAQIARASKIQACIEKEQKRIKKRNVHIKKAPTLLLPKLQHMITDTTTLISQSTSRRHTKLPLLPKNKYEKIK